jgi:phosphoinositide-3-kinase regulatory subunit 4
MRKYFQKGLVAVLLGNILIVFSLGSTRFFKVAKAKCKEGSVVVKVFVIHDPSLPLASYKTRLDGMLTAVKVASSFSKC